MKAENANYEDATATYSLEVTPAQVNVTANNKTKAYGTSDPAFDATVDGTIGKDTVDYSITRAAGENVGTYTITPAGKKDQGNYSVTYKTGTLTITKADAKLNQVTPTDYSGVYDGKAHGIAATATITEGTKISYKVGSGEWTETVPTILNVGKENITVKAENANYEDATATYSLEVTPAQAIVTAKTLSKAYGVKDPELTAEVSGLVNNEGTEKIVYTLSRAEGENTGRYLITPAGDAVQGNYEVTYVPADFVIVKSGEMAILVQNFVGIYDGSAHGTAATATVTEGTMIEYRVGGATGEWTTTVPQLTNAGSEIVTVRAANPNYEDPEQVTYTITINRRSVTLTSGSASKTYDGSALTSTGVTVSGDGFVTGEVSNIRATGSITNVGNTTNGITFDQGTAYLASNYNITYILGTLTINAVTTTITTTTTVTVPGPATIVEVPVPAAATPAVLGVSRTPAVTATPATTEQPAVLGATRGRATGDESQDGMRVIIILICAGAAVSMVWGNRKKKESNNR